MRSGYLSEIFVSFQGEGAHVGERHLFVRFGGCNIRCDYCDTPESLEKAPQCALDVPPDGPRFRQNPINSRDLAELVQRVIEKAQGIDAVALTGGEPLVQAPFLAEFLAASDMRVPVLLETNGVLPTQLRAVVDRVDIISMDIKLPSNSGERAFWTEHRSFLQEARTRETYVKIPVHEQTSCEEVSKAADLLTENAPEAEAFLQPIVNRDGTPQITVERLTEFYLLIRERHQRVRVLPQTHKLLGIR